MSGGSRKVVESYSLRGESRDPSLRRTPLPAAALYDFKTLRLSAGAAESPAQFMWTLFVPRCKSAPTAENGPISLSFLPSGLTGAKGQHCYTFERFASSPDEIHTYYYYHYKRIRVVLKEETRWS
jgi:hypothetical protein